MEKIENCIERNTKTITTKYNINGKEIIFEQRLLTAKEINEYKKIQKDIITNPEAFKALIKAQEVDEGKKIDADSLYIIRKAEKDIYSGRIESENFLIKTSLTPNLLYGGRLIVDNKEVEDNKIMEIVEILETSIHNELFSNAEKLSFETEDEVAEVKQQ